MLIILVIKKAVGFFLPGFDFQDDLGKMFDYWSLFLSIEKIE